MIPLPAGLEPGWAAAGLLGAGVVALASARLRLLTPDGALAAWLVGAVVVAGTGLYGGALLLAFFASASALGRLNPRREGPRRAGQVLANGGIAALAALLCLAGLPGGAGGPGGAAGGDAWREGALLALAGSLAAMAADTWATEAGMARGGQPVLLVGWRRVPPGTPGGVTGAGSVALLMGAALMAGIAAFLGAVAERRAAFLAVLAGGVAGALADSLLGAVLERRGWLGNDAVNALASAVGAGVAVALYRAP